MHTNIKYGYRFVNHTNYNIHSKYKKKQSNEKCEFGFKVTGFVIFHRIFFSK